MLAYRENNWKNKSGSELVEYGLTINRILTNKTRKEQETKIEKTSLVSFLSEERKRFFVNVCKRLKKNDRDFYQNKNLHATLLGFGPMSMREYQIIRKAILVFTNSHKVILEIKLDSIRPGSMYNKRSRPIIGLGNGTVIAIGDVASNIKFTKYVNDLTAYLLKDKCIQSILGKNFRRKFPAVWITLGYYNKKNNFKIDAELETIFKDYKKLDDISFHVSEISMVKSKYKNLRYPKIVKHFQV